MSQSLLLTSLYPFRSQHSLSPSSLCSALSLSLHSATHSTNAWRGHSRAAQQPTAAAAQTGPRAAHSSRGVTLSPNGGRHESGTQQQPKAAQHGRPTSRSGHAAQIYELYFVSPSPIHLEAEKAAIDATTTRRGEQGHTSSEISTAAREDGRWPARWMRHRMRVPQMWGTRREE
jgi:hypothetical protein